MTPILQIGELRHTHGRDMAKAHREAVQGVGPHLGAPGSPKWLFY